MVTLFKVTKLINLDLGKNFIRSFEWSTTNADQFHVLLSDNTLLTFASPNSTPKFEKTPLGTLVDFIADDSSFYFIDEDGNLFESDELVTNCGLTGDDLVLEKVAPNVLCVASSSLAVHLLLLDEEAFVVEKLELDLFEEIRVINDQTCASRYFIQSKHAVLCVSLTWLAQIDSGAELMSQSEVETLLTAPNATISGAALAAGRVPNSITQDGPVLVCSLSAGPGVLIPLLTLPTTLTSGSSRETAKAKPPTTAWARLFQHFFMLFFSVKLSSVTYLANMDLNIVRFDFCLDKYRYSPIIVH